MGEARVKENIAAPAQQVWALLANFGDTSWMPGGGGAVEVQGEGVGMQRIIPAGENKIREVLQSLDAGARTLQYAIPEGVPFPVRDYRATVRVHEGAAADACQLEWACTFTPDGVEEAQARALIEGLYRTMVGWVRAAVTAD